MRRTKDSVPPDVLPFCCFRGRCVFILIGAVVLLVGFPSRGWLQEIAPFRMTGVEGFVALRSVYQVDDSRLGTGSKSEQTQLTFDEEIFVLTHSYIYHPNLIKLDLGGGPIFDQERFTSDGQERTSSDIFYNATARSTFLEKKPYPLVLFYDQFTHPVSSGLAERFLLTDTRYGFTFSFLEPLAPIPFDVTAYSQTQQGEGPGQVVDESGDRLTLNAYKSLPDKGFDASFIYEFDRNESESGNPQFPITKTRTTTHSANLTHRHLFGSRDQARLTNLFSYVTQDEFPSREDIQVNPLFNWNLTDSLGLFSSYSWRESDVEDTTTKSQQGIIGLNHRIYESLFTEIAVKGSDIQTTGFSQQIYGPRGSISYRKKTFFGGLALHYGVLYENHDQESTAAEIPVFGEEHVLTGFIPSELDHDNVIVSTVVVSNETRSRTFTEGVDYRLIVVGLKTSIQRLLGGDIQDGQLVLVDYSFATTGDFEFSDFDQNYGARIDIFPYLTLYARFRNQDLSLISGTPTQPLNPIDSQLYGARLSAPIGRWTIGGDAEYENREEVIQPFKRKSFSGFAQISLPASTALAVTGRRVLQDNIGSLEDVDLVALDARLESRPWPRVRLSVEAGYLRDTGGTVKEENWFGRFLGDWRIGKLILSGEGFYLHAMQGNSDRDRFGGKVEIRREF